MNGIAHCHDRRIDGPRDAAAVAVSRCPSSSHAPTVTRRPRGEPVPMPGKLRNRVVPATRNGTVGLRRLVRAACGPAGACRPVAGGDPGADDPVQLDADEVRFDADGQAALLPAVKSEVWQVRLLLEGSAGEDFGGVEGPSGNVELAGGAGR